MKIMDQPRIKLLSLCVGLALAQMASTAAHADSGIIGDTTLANALNPTGWERFAKSDGDTDETKHTPTGQMYGIPPQVSEPLITSSGWEVRGSIEAGFLGGDADNGNALFRQYKDIDDGFYLNSVQLEADKPDSALFAGVTAVGVGNDDQALGFQFGRYNDWKLQAFFNETPHVFTSRYRSLWDGVGTANMTLKTLTPGGTANAATTDTNIENAVMAEAYTELGLVREKGGIRFDKALSDQWKFFFSYANEARKGARPFGLVVGGGGGTGGVEMPESIDYNTMDLLAGMSFTDDVSALNLTAAASLFRNDISTMNFENPMFLAAANGVPAGGFTDGRFDLYPDNDFYNLKGEYSRILPSLRNGLLTAVVSLASSRQDDDLIASTLYSGVAVNGVAGGSWNTTDSLSQTSADARIDTKLVDLGLGFDPAQNLSIKGKIRYHETDNATEYWACNPLTGQWGRLVNDGSGAAMINTVAYLAAGVRCDAEAIAALGVQPSAGNVNIRNVPYEYKQHNYTVSGDYRINAKSNLNGSVEREEMHREHRERDKTWEHKIKLGYVNRGLENGTVRLSGEKDWRRGSTYNSDPYEEFYSASLGPYPTTGNVASWIHINDLHRKFDMANRDQGILNGRFNYMLASNVDGAITMQFKDVSYPDSAYGRNGHQTQNSVNFDLNYQPTDKLTLYGYYSLQNGKMEQSSLPQGNCNIGTNYIWDNGTVNTTGVAPTSNFTGLPANLVATVNVTGANFVSVCGSASASSTLYPTFKTVETKQSDKNHVFGMGMKRDFGKVLLDLGYAYTRGTTSITYDFDPESHNLTPAMATLVGDGFADLTYSQHNLEINLVIPVSKAMSVRLLGRYEKGKINDWHYEGVDTNPSPAANQQTYLDSGPEDYDATVLGVFLKYTL